VKDLSEDLIATESRLMKFENLFLELSEKVDKSEKQDKEKDEENSIEEENKERSQKQYLC
jgi:hypothetical protein